MRGVAGQAALEADGARSRPLLAFSPLGEGEARALGLDADSLALRDAIELGQLTLAYQPKVRLDTGLCTGVEALARWRHPHKGLLGPDQFIPLAESNGLIVPLTAWIVEAAIQQCARWRECGLELTVAINVSPQSLVDGSFFVLADRALARYGIPPSSIGLELTETAAVAQREPTAAVLERMASRGIEVAIDDFGTGYGSLTYLRDFPVGAIKIDRSFVTRLQSDQRDATIVRATIQLAHSLGQIVVAEGVEDSGTAELLRSMGCDEAQGFHWGPAMAPDDLVAWLPRATEGRPDGPPLRAACW